MSDIVLAYNDESAVIYIEHYEGPLQDSVDLAIADGYTVVRTDDDSNLPNRYKYFFEAWEYSPDYSEVVVNLEKAKAIALREAVRVYIRTKSILENRDLLGLTNPTTVNQLDTSRSSLVTDINSCTTVEDVLQTLDGFMQDYFILVDDPLREEIVSGGTIIDPNYPL